MATTLGDSTYALLRNEPSIKIHHKIEATIERRWRMAWSGKVAYWTKQFSDNPNAEYQSLRTLHRTRILHMLRLGIEWPAIYRCDLDDPLVLETIWRDSVALALKRHLSARRSHQEQTIGFRKGITQKRRKSNANAQ